MTVHDLGYRGWTGGLQPAATRFVVVAHTGIRRAWQNRWLRRMLFVTWIPALLFGMGFFIYEQSVLYPQSGEGMTSFLAGPAESTLLAESLRANADNPEASRHAVWAWLLLTLFRYPQGLLMVLVVGLIGPSLISQDIRSRAFLLYFSRPLTHGEYVLGKFVTIWSYLAMISTAPALTLYGLGVLLSPQLVVIQATWDLPFRILAASIVLMLPTAALALCLSSMTQESRIAGFAWFAVWILGWFTYGVMMAITEATNGSAQLAERWTHFSLYHTLGRVQSWVFGFTSFEDVWVSLLILAALTAGSLVMIFRNVAAPMRA